MYLVYILQCGDGSLYTGITKDINRRFNEHASGKGGAYTRTKHIERIVYSEEHPDRSSASQREAEIKRWSRKRKLNLIQYGDPKGGG